MDDEELARLRTEIEDVKAQLAAREAETEAHELRRIEAAAENDRLRAEVAAASDAATAFDADVTAMRDELERADARLRDATESYRALVLDAEPWIADALEGDTVEALEASVVRARAVAARVRADALSQAQASRVPAGAPARGAPDVSHMTPEQKIRYGLAQRERA